MEANTLGRELVAASRVGFGANARGVGTEDTPDIRERGRIFRESARSFDFWVDNGLALIGSPETVTRQIAAGRERIGYDHFAGKFHIGRMPNEMVERSIKLFGKEVIPDKAHRRIKRRETQGRRFHALRFGIFRVQLQPGKGHHTATRPKQKLASVHRFHFFTLCVKTGWSTTFRMTSRIR